MDFMELIQPAMQEILTLFCITLSGFLIAWLQKEKQKLLSDIENAKAMKYIDMIDETISNCVAATTQTYVEALKNKNIFTKEAQQEAFSRTYENILTILNQEAFDYITEITDDVCGYLTTKIEANVHWQK